MVVSADTLLQGSWHALEQAGRLLRTAALVHDSGDASTAVVLSMFGREELGRSKILRDLAQSVTQGVRLSPADVQTVCENHVKKQAAGALSTTLRAEPPSQLDAAFRVRMNADPALAESQKASTVIEQATDAKRKRSPLDRHKMRERTLYVDLDETGKGWLRPSDFDSRRAFEEIIDAVNDYAAERDRVRDDVIDQDYPEMAAARANMRPKAVLPKPARPTLADRNASEPATETDGPIRGPQLNDNPLGDC